MSMCTLMGPETLASCHHLLEMTTAERSIRRLLQNPDASEDTKKHFKEANSDNDNDDLAKLYRLVWIDKHLPIKRATINRPTGRARCEEIQTPDECWVVETNAFAVLQAPMTIMIRQENLDCFDDLIKEHAGESFGDLAMSMSEAASTSEDHVDTGNDSMDIDKPDQTIASVPTSVFPNPFEAKVLWEENINEGVVVTGQAGIGKVSRYMNLRSTYTNPSRQKYPVASNPHLAPSCPPSHHMARHRRRSHALHRRRCF